MPIHQGQAGLLELVEVHEGFGGVGPRQRVARSGLHRVVELREQQPPVGQRERARRVPVVAAGQLSTAPGVEHVAHHDGGLVADGGTGLGARGAGDVTEGEDVGVAPVLQRVLVDVDISARVGRVGEGRGLDPVGGGLGRDQMGHGVLDLAGPAGHQGTDGDGASGAVDRADLAGQMHGDPVAGSGVGQDLRELRDAEHPRHGQHQMDVDVAQDTLAPPVVGREVGDLLRGASALDGPGRHGEDGCPRPGGADQVPGPGGEVEAIVARRAVAADGLREPGNLRPVELETGRHDELAVGDLSAVAQLHRPALRVDTHGRVLDPRDAAGHEPGPRSTAVLHVGTPTAGEGPQRLVVVPVIRVDEGDVASSGPPEPRRHRCAGGPGAYDDDRVRP